MPKKLSSRQTLLKRLEEDFERITTADDVHGATEKEALEKPLYARSVMAPPKVLQEQPQGPIIIDQSMLLIDIFHSLDRLTWLSEGPDSYDTIDDTIGTTTESVYSFEPFVLWAVNFVNNASAGNLLIRFTTGHGRVKQIKVPAQATFALKDIRGSLGSDFRVVADTGPTELIAFVTLKEPPKKALGA